MIESERALEFTNLLNFCLECAYLSNGSLDPLPFLKLQRFFRHKQTDWQDTNLEPKLEGFFIHVEAIVILSKYKIRKAINEFQKRENLTKEAGVCFFYFIFLFISRAFRPRQTTAA